MGIILLTAVVVLSTAATWLLTRGRAQSGPSQRWLVAVSVVVFAYVVDRVLVLFGIAGGPNETGLELVVAALAGAAFYLAFRYRIWERLSRRPPANASGAPAEAVKPPQPASPVAPLIFISYRRNDSGDATGRIYDRLVQRFGHDRIFKDVDSIPLGVDFRKHLADQVGQCRILLAIIGRGWQTTSAAGDARDFVQIEIEAALQRGIPVIPILVQNAAMPSERELPPALQPLAFQNGMAVRPDPDFHQDVDRLIRGLEAHAV